MGGNIVLKDRNATRQADARPSFAFWYVFASNGSDGFLLDLIRRPGESLARMVTYKQGHPPRLVRHGFPSAGLNGVPGTLGVNLGGIALDALGCRSTLPGMNLDARFALSGPSVRFAPRFVTWWFDSVPDFCSRYGVIERATCDGAVYENAPVTCSTYSLDSLARARWVLISAPRFAGTDLALEISAARLLGRWMPAARVFHAGREYHLNSALDSLLRLRIGRADDVGSGEPVFTASIRARGLHLDVEARGPIDQFARLDAEGETEIHTTLFGTCRATVVSAGETFVAERNCLLEVKN
ncbi:MAG: hypothetical protein WAJ87_25120 [Bryobacteraceae bacterium]